MKKIIFLSAVATLLLTAVSAIVYVNNEKDAMDDLFRANVEVLASDETTSTTIPCVKAVSICSYVVKDASGEYYNATTVGFRNVK